MGRPQDPGAFRPGEVMIPAMIGDLQERIPPLDVPPSEGLASGGGETILFGRPFLSAFRPLMEVGQNRWQG